ncbi:hypothetical protein D1007_57422 [Hordeum vulgare]|nr:hypothetical protein D1007_57422 [Hordeum vulgare]
MGAANGPVLEELADIGSQPVSGALFGDALDTESPQVTAVAASNAQFSFSAPCSKNRAPRNMSTPIVDSMVHRCTRGSVKRDGFKPILQELPMPLLKKR